MHEIDPIEAIGDLQVEVSAMRRIVQLLLPQHALNSENPFAALNSLQEVLATSSGIVSENARDAEETDYSERVNEETDRLIDQAREFIRAVRPPET